jgi:hypothetical protein
VIPHLIPNRGKLNENSAPPYPFVYHPEQYPERAANNPEPWFRKIKVKEPYVQHNLKFFGKKVEAKSENLAKRRDCVGVPQSWLTRDHVDVKDMPNMEEQLLNRAIELEV